MEGERAAEKRKRILVVLASLIAFTAGYLSTLGSVPSQDRTFQASASRPCVECVAAIHPVSSQ